MKMAVEFIYDLLDPARTIGPIFDKELRVSARRRRSYLLRFAYIVGLSIVVIWVWWAAVVTPGGPSPAGRILRLSEAGKYIITSIVWFQFCVTQYLAVHMLSSSISDEIYRRTLGVLMTTPMNSFQIVTGKLFSRLLQIMILLAISLPLLAVVRVFGGVPWDYLVSGLCITLTAVIFAGSLSLFFSIRKHQASLAARQTLSICLLLYLAPLIAEGLLFRFYSGAYTEYVRLLYYLNPFYVLVQNTQIMMILSPTSPSVIIWPLHCAIMLGLSALVLAGSMRSVRKVALKDVTGQLQLFRKGKRVSINKAAIPSAPPEKSDNRIRPVTGSPILWKEMRMPRIKQGKISTMLGLILVVGLVITAYACGIYYDFFDEAAAQVAFILVFYCFGLGITATEAAGTITKEKEARTWPLLLTTTLDDRQIAWGKMIGAVRQATPIWLLMAGHILLFSLIGYIHPIAIFQVAIVVAAGALFIAALGLFFSTTFKRTSTAVTTTTLIGFGLWLFFPWCCGGGPIFLDPGLLEFLLLVNPLAMAGILVGSTVGVENADQLRYGIDNNYMGIFRITVILLGFGVLYALLTYIFASRAMKKFRRNIFSANV